jgi:hypothetical protein
LGYKWDTKRRTSKVKWKDVDKPKFFYELICVLAIVAMIIYSIYTGTAPDNTGF